MTANKKPWEKTRNYARRPEGIRSEKIFYIFCEGEKTEPNYFDSFKLSKAKIKIYGEGRNTRDLIYWVRGEVNSLKRKREFDENEDEVWCVFDRDSFEPSDFDNAVTMAESSGYQVAYSNEAFELWYILHFDYMQSALSREQYIEILDKKFGHKYQKNARNTYDELSEYRGKAIKFAEKLLKEINNGSPHKNNPTTKVHLLVKKLNEYTKE